MRRVLASVVVVALCMPSVAMEVEEIFPPTTDKPEKICREQGPCYLVPKKRMREFLGNQLDEAYRRGFNNGRERCGNYTEWES